MNNLSRITTIMLFIFTILALNVITVESAVAATGACRYMTMVRGRAVEKCVKRNGNSQSCESKSVTGSFKWCENESCDDCPKLGSKHFARQLNKSDKHRTDSYYKKSYKNKSTKYTDAY